MGGRECRKRSRVRVSETGRVRERVTVTVKADRSFLPRGVQGDEHAIHGSAVNKLAGSSLAL